MNILITGANGFIGKNLGCFLKLFNHNVIGIDRKTDNELNIWDAFYTNDIRNDEAIRWICEKEQINAIVHLAAEPGVPKSIQTPIDNFSQNTFGTLLCLEGARKANVKNFIFASSGGTVLGHQEPPVHENTVSCPASPYGASKISAEAYCQSYASSFNINTVILRFSNVYGPYSQYKEGTLIPSFFHALNNDEKMPIYGDGNQTRDFIYVEDICSAIHKCLISFELFKGEIFQLGNGIETSINYVIYMLNHFVYNEFRKYVECEYKNESRQGDVKRNYVEPHKANVVLDWHPHTPIEDGLWKTFMWWRRRNLI